jgi:hypothetical protein
LSRYAIANPTYDPEVLSLVVIGIPLLLAVLVLTIVFPIIGGVKANNGELWRYPLSIQFLS